MARFLKNRIKTKGASPGSLIFIGKQKIAKPRMRVLAYSEEDITEIEWTNIEEINIYRDKQPVTWLNIDGIHDIELIQKIGEIFNIHSLHLEDMLNTDHRPVLIEGDDYIAFILKMLYFDDTDDKLKSEQCSIILKEKFLITFQERVGDVFEPVRERIRKKKGRIRTCKGDYLAFALFDTIIDNYIYLIEGIGERIERLEEKIYYHPSRQLSREIYNHKMELNFFRKSVRPVRELISQLMKSETGLIERENYKFLHDLNQQAIQAIEAIETYSAIVTDQLNMYNTIIGNRLNEIMKILTIFTAIFIPLTFFTGIYGMNFEYMPEIKYKYSYLFFWIWIIIVTSAMIIYFRKKKWLGK